MEIIYSTKKFRGHVITDRREVITLDAALGAIVRHLPPSSTSLNLKHPSSIGLITHGHSINTYIEIVGALEEMVELRRFCALWAEMHARREQLIALRHKARKQAALKTSPKPERSSNQASAKRGHRGTPETNVILKRSSEEATLLDLHEVECAALAYLDVFSDDLIKPFHLLSRERLLELVIYKMTTSETTLEDLKILAA